MPDQNCPSDRLRVPPEELRWHCDESLFPFETTAEVEPILGVIGQQDAVEALRYGLEIDAPGQNIFVRGLVGTGRLTLVDSLVKQIRPHCAIVPDLCYVHNFADPDCPRLIELPRGGAPLFRERINELVDFIRDKLAPALASDELRVQQAELEEKLQQELDAIGKPFEEELSANGLVVVTVQAEGGMRPVLLPLVKDEPTSPERLDQLQQEGQVSAEEADAIREKASDFTRRFQELGQEIQKVREAHRGCVRALFETQARSVLQFTVHDIETAFPQEKVKVFLGEVIEDVIRRQLGGQEEEPDGARRYRVNVVSTRGPDDSCPVVMENTPTLVNLLGTIGRKILPQGLVHSDHLMITAGSLLRANGGYIVMEARDVLTEPGAWKVLMRTLRTGKLEIVPHDSIWFATGAHIKPDPIPISVKVVLLGDPELYYLLDENDEDFSNLFKVLADFDSSIERDAQGLEHYAGVLARIAREEQLPPYTRGGVAALAEHGARIAARSDRLTTRFGRLVDLAREAAFLARGAGRAAVSREDVVEAVRRSKRRADLPARHFRRMVSEGAIRIQTRGEVVGQVNGLAVTRSGPLTYGFPARITATIGAGHAGTISIEREAQLSGAIHTKGFYILGGLLRHLLRTDHPLAFSASVAFEQSYGGIDGDSASGAEICCLLSALTDVPLRQDLAMTGAIDQFGHVQAIGAVSEKIEGFYDACASGGLTGTQGVIIPQSNVVDLMLRDDVVQASAAGRFHVYAVETIQEALEVFTGQPVGELDEEGLYAEGTLLFAAVEKAREYWIKASGREAVLVEEEEGEEGEGEEEEETEEEEAGDDTPEPGSSPEPEV